MINLRDTVAKLSRNGDWPKLLQGAARGRMRREPGPASTPLQEVFGFGTNPGDLRMFAYLPRTLAARPALMVVLHGCAQTAAGYDFGAGWSTLADRYGFALLMPEQQRANNPNACFNWFQPEDSERDRGEALSVRQMIEKVVADKGINPSRVFVTGLSAGGAMTSVMLACYPDVFAGGAIVAGLPYGAATNVQEAFESMFQSPARPARAWGDLVRNASPHKGPWPRVSVWHGSTDKTVIPANAGEIIKQWTDVHGLAVAPSAAAVVDGYPREVWRDKSGHEVIESYTITGMGHGTPLSAGDAEGKFGEAGPFLLDVGISSSYHIAKFFGIATPVDAKVSANGTARPAKKPRAEIAAPLATAKNGTKTQDKILEGEILDKNDDAPNHVPPSSPFEIGAVITKALKAAGLIKN